MFNVLQVTKKGLNMYQMTDLDTGEYVCILPDTGCALNNYTIHHNGKLLDLIEGYEDDSDLRENLNKIIKGHVLFPFPNRIFGGSYEFQGSQYQLLKNYIQEGNACHGLLLDRKFMYEMHTATDQEASVTFVRKLSGNDEGYPFKCQIRIRFVYTHQILFIETEIVNIDETDIPVGLGWHPYFKIGERIDELFLEIPGAELWQQSTKKFLPVYYPGNEPIGKEFLDSCFRYTSGKVSVEDKKLGVKLTLDSGKDFPFVQVYTPPHRKYIAIEPMTCVPDSFNNKVGLKILNKNERWIRKCSIKVTKSKINNIRN